MEDKSKTPKIKIIHPFHEVGSRLRQIRESLKKTQVEMAPELGISLPMMQSYEAGKHLISPVGIVALVEMGYNANWFLCEKGEMKISDQPVTTSASTDNKALKSVVKALWDEIEDSDANISGASAAGIIALAYTEYLASDKDYPRLCDKIKALVQIADQGEE